MSQLKSENRTNETTEILSDPKISETGALPIDESLFPVEGISFYILRLSRVIVVHTNNEFFIGRDVNEDIWKPMVDLSEFDGFANGVSRRHALVRPVHHGYEIVDLVSTNGTWLDDQRLIPNKPYPLAPGTQLRVGRERLLIIYRSAQVTTG